MVNIETNRIENKEQLNEDFEQEVIAFLNYKEGGIIYVGIRVVLMILIKCSYR